MEGGLGGGKRKWGSGMCVCVCVCEWHCVNWLQVDYTHQKGRKSSWDCVTGHFWFFLCMARYSKAYLCVRHREDRLYPKPRSCKKPAPAPLDRPFLCVLGRTNCRKGRKDHAVQHVRFHVTESCMEIWELRPLAALTDRRVATSKKTGGSGEWV